MPAKCFAEVAEWWLVNVGHIFKNLFHCYSASWNWRIKEMDSDSFSAIKFVVIVVFFFFARISRRWENSWVLIHLPRQIHITDWWKPFETPEVWSQVGVMKSNHWAVMIWLTLICLRRKIINFFNKRNKASGF